MRRIGFIGNNLLLLTNKHLYLSEDLGVRWKQIFNSTPAKGRLETFKIKEEIIFLGTTKGLFSANLNQLVFKKNDHFPSGEIPFSIKTLSKKIYFVLTDRSLWKTRDGGLSFEKLLGAIPKETELLNDRTEFSESKNLGSFSTFEVSPDGKNVWVGTSRGVYGSKTGGLHFYKLPSSGLRTDSITQLLTTPPGLIAGTQKGVYRFADSEWKRLKTEKSLGKIHDLIYFKRLLWVSSDDGIVKITLPLPENPLPIRQELHYGSNLIKLLNQLIASEPKAREVQEAAIRYSNTPNGKTKSWQIFSRLKSLLPSVSYSVGNNRGNNIDLDRGGTRDPDLYIVGPEDWNYDMDIDLSWDLGDLLFSSSQTSIDSREKLMVELRDELVSEVTRLYYERRRLQIDVLVKTHEQKKLLESWLRIEELTSQIDGMTGGWFGENIKNQETIADFFKKHKTQNTKHKQWDPNHKAQTNTRFQ